MSLTLHQATSPDALTVMSMVRLKGAKFTQSVVAMWIREVDALVGDRAKPEAIAMMANMLIDRMKYRSIASVLMVLRDGMGYTDEDGKVYGTITWPKLALWAERHEERVMAIASETHSSKVVKNDNVGRDWMDKLERGSQDYTIGRQQREIERLRKKLDIKNKGNK